MTNHYYKEYLRNLSFVVFFSFFATQHYHSFWDGDLFCYEMDISIFINNNDVAIPEKKKKKKTQEKLFAITTHTLLYRATQSYHMKIINEKQWWSVNHGTDLKFLRTWKKCQNVKRNLMRYIWLEKKHVTFVVKVAFAKSEIRFSQSFTLVNRSIVLICWILFLYKHKYVKVDTKFRTLFSDSVHFVSFETIETTIVVPQFD